MKHKALTLLFFVILDVILQPCVGKDLYSVLGVARNAGQREIKMAYARLAKQWLVCVSTCTVDQ